MPVAVKIMQKHPSFWGVFYFFIFGVVVLPVNANQKMEFDLSLLQGINNQQVDINSLITSNNLISGRYPMKLTVNGKQKDIISIDIDVSGSTNRIIWATDSLNALSLKRSLYRELLANPTTEPPFQCKISAQEMSVNCQIPQIYQEKNNSNYAFYEARSEGEKGFLASYRANYSNYYHKKTQTSDDNIYSSIMLGLNVDAWRLRSSFNLSSNYESTVNNSYLFRNIASLNSQLKIGQAFSNGNILDSFYYKGISLATDTSMLPSDAVDFMPVVTGIAKTHALITIKKDDVILYQENVAPGPFSLDYLPNIQGGFTVEITEANGETKTENYYSSGLSQFIRKGQWRYHTIVGQYDGYSKDDAPRFLLATLHHGLTENINLYSGLLFSPDYQNLTIGSIVNIGLLGTVSADISYAQAEFDQRLRPYLLKEKPSSYATKLQYSKKIAITQTQLYLGSHHFSSENYLNFSDYAELNHGQSISGATLKQRDQISLSQPIDKYSLGLQYQRESYWKHAASNTISVNINGTWDNKTLNSPSWNFQLQHRKNSAYSNIKDRQISFYISIPLTWQRNHAVSYRYFNRSQGDNNQQVMLSGNMLDAKFNYSMSFTDHRYQQTNSSELYGSLGYKSPVVDYSGYYSQSQNTRQYGAKIQGSIVATADAIAFSPQNISSENTIAVVNTAGVSDVKINNIRTLWNGAALLDNLTPYRHNKFSLDSKSLPLSAVSDNLTQMVAPTKGAIASLTFNVERQNIAILNLSENSKKPPLGAIVYDGLGKAIGLVSNNQEVYLDKFSEQQNRYIYWDANKCELLLLTKNQETNHNISIYQAKCQ